MGAIVQLFLGFFVLASIFIGGSKTVELLKKPAPSVETTQTAAPSSSLTPQATPTEDPDPIADCNFEHKFNVKKMRRSACIISFECEIGDKWPVYTSRKECIRDQKLYEISKAKSEDIEKVTKYIKQLADQAKALVDNASNLRKNMESDCDKQAQSAMETAYKNDIELNEAWGNTGDIIPGYGTVPSIQILPNQAYRLSVYNSCKSGYLDKISSLQSSAEPYLTQARWYQEYADSIPLGSGAGACSSHKGVSCSANKGNFGQVTCADGWSQSKVYYFNVKECFDHFMSSD